MSRIQPLYSKSQFLKDDLRYILFSKMSTLPATPLGKKKAHAIIEVVISHVARHGALMTSMSEIAKKTDLPRSSISHYFKTLDEIHESSFQFIRFLYQAFVLEAIGTETHPEKIFKIYFFAALDWPLIFPKYSRAWISFFHLTLLNPKFRDLNTESVRIGYERLLALIDAGKNAKVFNPESTSSAARAIHLVLTGLILSEATEDNAHAQEQRNAMYDFCCKILNLS